MSEIWKDIPGYDSYYQVSNYGRVRSWRNAQHGRRGEPRIRKVHEDDNGYYTITLSDDTVNKSYKVHQVVAKVFIPNPEEKPCINHKDSDRGNNHVDNLEWCTYQENMDHAIKNGRIKRGEKAGRSKLTRNQVLQIRSIYENGWFDKDQIAEAYNMNSEYIMKIIRNQAWKHI